MVKVIKEASRFSELPGRIRSGLGTPGQNPFFNAVFLEALETSDSVCEATGWQPMHCWIEEEGLPLFYVPLYGKNHSWGEFVFDQSWAQAYHRYGVPYYPKLVTSVPFTPSVGPRWWCEEGQDAVSLWQQMMEWVVKRVKGGEHSSWHLLFADASPPDTPAVPLLTRTDTQFHWVNRQYQHFDDFLSQLKSRKRKGLRREREKVAEQGVKLVRKVGSNLGEADWMAYYHCYCNTYHERGMSPHLTLPFFLQVGEQLADQILMVQAWRGKSMIGAALCFFDDQHLYGRHWGALANVDCLHFEACFYQGIEFCIEQGLKRFDPGTQGEHKLLRGFEPTTTTSWHYIAHEGFRQAIAEFLRQEQTHTQRYQTEAGAYLPFRLDE